MIVSWSRGRLGNQFFQYSLAMEAARPSETVLLVGYEELKKEFPDNLGLIIPVSERWQKWSRKIHRLVKKMAKRGLAGTVDTSLTKREISSVDGLTRIRLVVDELAQVEFTNRGKWVYKLVRGRLENFECSRYGLDRDSCFIHVRRTDYATWPRPDIPALLPSAWFHVAVERIREVNEKAHFFVVTDDPEWVSRDSFLSKFPVFDGDAIETWLAMASCNYGILSPSSFAYWAANVARESPETKTFVAPYFWGAWRAREWYPPGMKDGTFLYLEVEETLI